MSELRYARYGGRYIAAGSVKEVALIALNGLKSGEMFPLRIKDNEGKIVWNFSEDFFETGRDVIAELREIAGLPPEDAAVDGYNE